MNAQEFKDIVTALVLIAGAFGAAWKWGFAEFLRRRSELPTLDGNFTARIVSLGGTATAVEFCATWRNKGTVPVFADCEKTMISIFPVTPGVGGAGIDNYWDQKASQVLKPLKGLFFYFLEPGTDSEIKAVVTLPNDSIFVARFELVVPVPSKARGLFVRAMRRFLDKEAKIKEVAWYRIHLFSTSS